MADVPIDCDFPIWGLLPKKETGVVSFLNKNPNYDGRDTIIAIFDSGVDPAAAGLKVTTTGETKVIERFDCSGCGDVDTSTVLTKVVDGCITGLTGRKLTIPEVWKNPSGEWRVGVLYPFTLYPSKLKERVQEHRREHRWDVGHKSAYAAANKQLQDFETDNATNTTLSQDDKQWKEELEARVEVLSTADKKYTDLGPTYDCVLFHDGTVWRACIDTSERGELGEGPLLGEYSATREHAHLTPLDEMTVSVNVHDNGAVLELVGMCSTHGTHVAAIAAGYFPDEPDKNGVAPGAKIVSLTIGDSRLGSMETGTALVRACIKVAQLCEQYRIDVINMSYGEHAHWAHAGRIGDIIASIVNRYGVSWTVSAGNHGPALCTVGAPPDIAQPVLIGVGAYVSPEMMSAAYSMRARIGGGAFSWSSRGPCADGAAGVSVCAPGGAVASVARFTLRNSQLMNGTSMAAPHVAGAVAALISGLKAKGLQYSPYSIKRALENSASYLSHVEPWAQGCGLLNIERAFENLTAYHEQPERDVTFSIQCGNNHAKGILLRPKLDDVPKDIGITIEPQFLQSLEDRERTVISLKESIQSNVSIKELKSLKAKESKASHPIQAYMCDTNSIHFSQASRSLPRQIAFGVRLALAGQAAWVSAPAHLHMMNVSRPVAVRVDPLGLPPGPHFTSINAYDVSCPEKGPVFRIPITVFQPEPLKTAASGAPAILADDVTFAPAALRRHFVIPPADATWAVLRVTTRDTDTTGRFLVHVMQILPRQSCRSHETQKMINVTADAPTLLPFQIVGGVTLEIVIAKYWANIGDMRVSYSVELRGVRPDCGRRVHVHAAGGLTTVGLTALKLEDTVPHLQLKNTVPVLRPSESKLTPLTARDVIPPGRQIYQLINTYNFHLAKGTEVSPIVSLLSDMLYESEFESQMWMLYNSSKQLMAVGDAYPSKYSVKLEKGDYVLRLCVRHDTRALLERLQELTVQLSQRLATPLTLDVYADQPQALTGGKKFSSGTVSSGNLLPIYIAPLPADKISRSNLTIGQTLTGTATFAKDELGRKVDTYQLQYVVCEPPRRPPPNNNNNNNSNNSSKEKNKQDEYSDALKDFYTTWLPKLEGEKLEQVYAQLVESFPAHLGAHIAYLHGLDPPADTSKLPHPDQAPDVTAAWCEQIIAIADKVIKQVDQEKLLAYLGMKNDTRPDAAKIKQEQEKLRGYLVDALCRKGTALCRLVALADGPADKLTTALRDNMADLLKFTDLTDTKVLQYGVWHCVTLQHWARAARLLQRAGDERPARDIDERLARLYARLGWHHLAAHTAAALPARHPAGYRPF